MTDTDRTCLAAVDADKDELMHSSSGGAFSVLARRTLNRGGVVYGHAFDEGLHVACVRVDDPSGLDALRGSKYVQSDMGDAMARVRDDLKAGLEVLFSGTPCQVDGLLAFLGGSQDGLLTVDIVCHGVPSQEFLRDCMGAEMKGSVLEEIRFRDKREGWGCGGGATTTITTPVLHRHVTRERPFSPENSYYYKRFLSGDIYRESCYRCPYAGGERPGDFTIGDFWGVDFRAADLNPKHGVSVIIVNTEKAEALVPYIKGETSWATRPLEEAVCGNDQLKHPTPRPEARDVVLERWREEGIGTLEEEYRRSTSLSSKKWITKRAIKKLVKEVLGR